MKTLMHGVRLIIMLSLFMVHRMVCVYIYRHGYIYIYIYIYIRICLFVCPYDLVFVYCCNMQLENACVGMLR
jgi:hypothetical protein